MHEDEMTRRLTDAAAHVAPRPDLAEVEFGAARLRGRRRVATGVAAAMLVAGAGGAGFGLGQSLAGDESPGLASATEVTGPPLGTAVPETVPPATVEMPSAGTTIASIESPSVPAAVAPAPVGDASYSSYYPGGSGQPFTLISTRTLAQDVRIRVLRSEAYVMDGELAIDPGGWRPPPFCIASADLRVTVDGADVVDIGYGSWFDDLFGEAMATTFDLGVADGQPLRVAVVQSFEATSAAITWNDGGTDQAPFDNGVVVLAVPGSNSWENEYSLELTTPDGPLTLTAADMQYWSNPDYVNECSPPPPALPDAGDQPADPVAEQVAIEERFQLVWDRSMTYDDKPAGLLDDRTGIDAATEAVFAGGFAEAAQSAVQSIAELVFTSPTEAWFRYGIETSYGYFGDRYGIARLTGDGWTFLREMVCQDLALAGGQCDPPAFSIYPPSWYDLNGQQCIDTPTTEEQGLCAGYDEVTTALE